MLISVFKNHENSSPSVVLLTGYSDDLSVNSIKRGIYLTNVYYQKIENKTIVYVKSSAYVYISTLCIGMNGSLKLSHENNLDLPSDAIEIPISWQEFSNIWELEGLLGVSSSTIFKGKGYIQLKTEDDIDKVYEPGVYAIKGTSYNDQTLLVFSHNLGQSTVQFRTNNYGGFLVFRIKWWNGGWGTWKTVSLT